MMLSDIASVFEIVFHEIPAHQFLLVFLLFVVAPKLLDKLLAYSKLSHAKKLLSFVKDANSVPFENEEEREALQSIKRTVLNKMTAESLPDYAVREVKDFVSTFPVTSIYLISLLLALIQVIVAGGSIFDISWKVAFNLALATIALIAFDVALQRTMSWISRKLCSFLNKRFEERRLQDALLIIEENRKVLQTIISSTKEQINSVNNQVLINRNSSNKLSEVKSKVKVAGILDEVRFELIEVKAGAESQISQFEAMVFELGTNIEECEKLVELNKGIPESSHLLCDLFYAKELFRELRRLVMLNSGLAEKMIDEIDSIFEEGEGEIF